MDVIETGRETAERIEVYDSKASWSRPLGDGGGESHVYVLHFDPGGEIGAHEAGFDQLFIVVDGSGWGAGANGVRIPLRTGQAARFRKGEMHSKGSDEGMTAVMIQSDGLSRG